MVDESFIPTLGIKLIAGRNFSKEFSDSASAIVNQEALKQIGWKIHLENGLITRVEIISVSK
jgi:putative ABC transport system permease protein